MSSKQDFICESILLAVEEAQRLLNDEFAKYADKPPLGNALDQEGLRNGKEIVLEYLSVGEEGFALEHLIYMIKETGIILSVEAQKRIHDAASAMQMELKI